MTFAKTVLGCWLVVLWVTPTVSQETPQRGGMLEFGVTGDPATRDCHRAVSVLEFPRLLPHYSTLLKIDPDNYPSVVGDAAASWDNSSDGLSYTFHLRPNILFHDGTRLTSEDVRATYDRLRNPQGGAVSWRQSHFADIERIETPDPLTVVFTLKHPNAAMQMIFASPYNCLYSASRLAKDPRFPETNVMGTGPFRFDSYISGGDWKGTRFDQYFIPGKPYLDGFIAHTVAGPAVTTALASGRIMTEFRGLTPDQRDQVMQARAGKSRVFDVPWAGANMLTFNAERKPFDDRRVRHALSIAIDRWQGSEALERQTQLSRVGAFQAVGSTFGLSKEELLTQPGFGKDMDASRAEARKLLSEAGQQGMKFTILNRANYAPYGVFLIDQWRRIGVTVDQQFPETANYFERQSTGNFDVLFDVTPDIVDDPFLQLSMFPSREHNPANRARYNDPKVDELFERQLRATNVEERKLAYRELESYMLHMSYYAPFFWGRRIIVMANEIQGFTPTPAPGVGLQLADVWLKD